MRKSPLVVDSLDHPNAGNTNIPKTTKTDYRNIASIIAIFFIGILPFWILGITITTLIEDYTARRIILWIPFVLLATAACMSVLYWIRKVIIFDGIENNTSIIGLQRNKDMIAAVLLEQAKSTATAYHQNVTYGDNTNNTTSTSTNLSNDTQSAPDNDNSFIEMSTILDIINKK